MTKNIISALETAQGRELTTLVTCWKVTRKDGIVFGYTNSDSDITFDGVAYRARTGFDATDIETSNQLNVDTVDLAGIVGTDQTDISLADVLAGKWDGASVHIFQLDRADLAAGAMPLRKGWLGDVKVSNKAFKAELRGLMQALQQTVGDVYTIQCRADLGDTRCGVNLVPYTVAGVVLTVTSSRDFVVAMGSSGSETFSEGWFSGGKLTFDSGLNDGLSMEVKRHTNVSGGGQRFELQIGMPYEIAAGDTFTVYAGCDKAWSTCRSKFSNGDNFRGFPHIPGKDKLVTDIKVAQQGG